VPTMYFMTNGSMSRVSPNPSDDRQTRRSTPCASIARMMFRVASARSMRLCEAGAPTAQSTAS
jgi:hypothetical protein